VDAGHGDDIAGCAGKIAYEVDTDEATRPSNYDMLGH